jgi:predicted amidohydrolase YtcJ
MFRIWGLKCVLDGARRIVRRKNRTSDDLISEANTCGNTEAISYTARHSLKVGVHARGDRAVRTLLGV